MKIPPVFIIAGEQGEGKTTKAWDVVKELMKHNVEVSGFVAPGEWNANKRVGFSIMDVNSGTTKLLCQDKPGDSYQEVGRFYFDPETIRFGDKILLDKSESNNQLKVIDEIGFFELEGKVWARTLKSLVEENAHPLLITIRNKFVQDVINRFNLKDAHIFSTTTDASTIAEHIKNQLLLV